MTQAPEGNPEKFSAQEGKKKDFPPAFKKRRKTAEKEKVRLRKRVVSKPEEKGKKKNQKRRGEKKPPRNSTLKNPLLREIRRGHGPDLVTPPCLPVSTHVPLPGCSLSPQALCSPPPYTHTSCLAQASDIHLASALPWKGKS
jgi:hypothetical protein